MEFLWRAPYPCLWSGKAGTQMIEPKIALMVLLIGMLLLAVRRTAARG
jgi:hypothetical protein